MGLMLLGEANRQAPAQAELRPTCAGASCVNLHVILTLWGLPWYVCSANRRRPFSFSIFQRRWQSARFPHPQKTRTRTTTIQEVPIPR